MDDGEHQAEQAERENQYYADLRDQIRDGFIDEGVARIQSHVSWMDSVDEVVTTARLAKDGVLDLSGSPAYQSAASIYTYVVDDILPNVDAIPEQDLDLILSQITDADPFAGTSFDGTQSDPGGWPA